MNQSSPNGVVGHPIDQDEAAGLAIVFVGIERQRSIESQVADSDLVQSQRARRQVFERVDLYLVLCLLYTSGITPFSRQFITVP